jgi:uncharacterized protein
VKIQNEFEVHAPIDRVWAYLLDVQKIAPCAPGADLTEVVDDRTWKGRVHVKVGPVAMSFAGTVVIQDRDDGAHTVTLKADGREQRGRGAASALVQSRMEAVDGGTKVFIDTELTISGAAAQYGRGMVGDISERLTREFADCLQARIAAEEPAHEAEPLSPRQVPEGAAPVKGLRLGLWALWRAVARFFKRLFGRRPT